MGRLTPLRRRQIAAFTVIAMVPLAAMIIAMTDLLQPRPEPVALDYRLTAAIDESGTTVGIADSHIWELTLPNGQPDFAAMDEHLQAMQDLGVDHVRVIIPWRGNEPWGPPGTLPSEIEQQYWERSDYIINRAAERGMAVLGVLNHAPEWGSAFPETWASLGFEEAPDPELYAAYAARVVERYGSKVSAYEIWNEPNALSGWFPTLDAAAYTEVLKAAYTAIKAVNGDDPNDPLVVAGVLGAVVTSPATLDPRTFVQTMYANGAQGYFDALSFHPYHYSLPFSEGEETAQDPWKANSPLEQVIAIRQLMIDNGDAALRIWATEYGLPTFGELNEVQQQEYIADFLDAWSKLQDADGTSYAGPSFLYTLRDAFVNGELTEATSLGLFKYDVVTGEWVMKEAAKWLYEYLDPDPTDPPDQPGTPNLAEQIAQALQNFFNQVQAAFANLQASLQNFVNSFNAMLNSIAQAIADIFNPGGPAAQTLPAEVQDDFAEGTRTAAMSLAVDTADTTDAAAPSASETVAAKNVPAPEAPEASEVPEVTEGPVTEVTEEPVTEVTEPTEVTEEPVADTTEASTNVELPVESEGSTDTTEDSDSTETKVEVESETDQTAFDADSGSKSREPVRTGLVARPGEIGDGDADDAGDSADSSVTADTPVSDASDSDADSDSDSGSGSDDGGSSGSDS